MPNGCLKHLLLFIYYFLELNILSDLLLISHSSTNNFDKSKFNPLKCSFKIESRLDANFPIFCTHNEYEADKYVSGQIREYKIHPVPAYSNDSC